MFGRFLSLPLLMCALSQLVYLLEFVDKQSGAAVKINPNR
jgi:hypothetical protein